MHQANIIDDADDVELHFVADDIIDIDDELIDTNIDEVALDEVDDIDVAIMQNVNAVEMLVTIEVDEEDDVLELHHEHICEVIDVNEL